jgi:hypothetical protein
VDTDKFEVKITGLDLVRCMDYYIPSLLYYPVVIDPICEPYWKFYVNGTTFQTGNQAKSAAPLISLPGRVRTFVESNPFQISRPKTQGTCVTVHGDIYDSDDGTSSSAGDEHGPFFRPSVCFQNGVWVGLQTDPATPYTVTVTLSGGKIGILPPFRTQYRVFYTIRQCPAAGC